MSMSFLARWAISTGTTLFIIFFSPGIAALSFYNAFMSAVILGLYNAVIPSLISAFSFSRSIITLGAFSLIGNSFMIYMLDNVRIGLRASSLKSIILASVTISVITWFMTLSIGDRTIIKMKKI